MSFASLSRRQFIGGGAKLGTASVLLAAAAGAHALVAPTTAASNDLLFALGQRMAQDAMHALNSEHLNLVYFDHAGRALSPLREGMENILSRVSGASVNAQEVSGAYGAIVGRAVFTDQKSGAQVSMNIFASALSELSMIEGATNSASVQKHAVMAASADAFYAVS